MVEWRKFEFSDSDDDDDADIDSTDSSGSSAEDSEDDGDKGLEASSSGYKIADLECLQTLLNKFTVCSHCRKGSVSVVNCHDTGLGSVLRMKCSVCDHSGNAPLSGKTGRTFDLNRRSVLAMRCIGCGWSALEKFCGIMNLPPPVSEPAFSSHQKTILAATHKVADKALIEVAAELRSLTNSDEVAVTFDGTWMRRGYSSLYGVFVCIGWESGRVLDIVVKSRYCQERCLWTEKKDKGSISAQEFLDWQTSHNCKINTKSLSTWYGT